MFLNSRTSTIPLLLLLLKKFLFNSFGPLSTRLLKFPFMNIKSDRFTSYNFWMESTSDICVKEICSFVIPSTYFKPEE